MNSFKINKLIINNIQSYYGKHVINFNDLNNFILINGKNKSSEKQSNGSGKSTLFKSIIYGLGILKRTPKTIKSKGSTDESEIGIELFNDKTNEKFQIVKTIFDDNKPSTLQINENGKNLDLQRITSFQDYFEKNILGIDIDSFKYLRIFTPETKNLLSMGESETLKVLERLFKIEKLDEYYNIVQTKIRNLEQEIYGKDILIEREEKEINKIKKENQTKDISNKKYVEIENNIKENEDIIKEKEQELQNINKDLIEDLKERSKELQKIRKEITSNMNNLKSNIKTNEKEIEKINKLSKKNQCPTCYTKIKENDEIQQLFQSIIDKQEEQIEIDNDNLTNDKKTLKNVDDEREETINKVNEIINLENKYKNEIESQKKNISKFNRIKENLIHKDKQQSDKQIKERNEEIKKITKEKEYSTEMLNIYLYLQQIFSSKSQIRKNLLNEILEVSLRHYLNYYSTFLFNDDERMDFLFDNNHLIFGLSNKNKLFKEYSILSTGERKKIEIILILSLNSLINNINRPKLNLFIFDEFFDGLDEESVNGLMDLLNSYQLEHDDMFLITTHKNNIELSDTSIINVIKQGTKSMIQNTVSI